MSEYSNAKPHHQIEMTDRYRSLPDQQWHCKYRHRNPPSQIPWASQNYRHPGQPYWHHSPRDMYPVQRGHAPNRRYAQNTDYSRRRDIDVLQNRPSFKRYDHSSDWWRDDTYEHNTLGDRRAVGSFNRNSASSEERFSLTRDPRLNTRREGQQTSLPNARKADSTAINKAIGQRCGDVTSETGHKHFGRKSLPIFTDGKPTTVTEELQLGHGSSLEPGCKTRPETEEINLSHGSSPKPVVRKTRPETEELNLNHASSLGPVVDKTRPETEELNLSHGSSLEPALHKIRPETEELNLNHSSSLGPVVDKTRPETEELNLSHGSSLEPAPHKTRLQTEELNLSNGSSLEPVVHKTIPETEELNLSHGSSLEPVVRKTRPETEELNSSNGSSLEPVVCKTRPETEELNLSNGSSLEPVVRKTTPETEELNLSHGSSLEPVVRKARPETEELNLSNGSSLEPVVHKTIPETEELNLSHGSLLEPVVSKSRPESENLNLSHGSSLEPVVRKTRPETEEINLSHGSSVEPFVHKTKPETEELNLSNDSTLEPVVHKTIPETEELNLSHGSSLEPVVRKTIPETEELNLSHGSSVEPVARKTRPETSDSSLSTGDHLADAPEKVLVAQDDLQVASDHSSDTTCVISQCAIHEHSEVPISKTVSSTKEFTGCDGLQGVQNGPISDEDIVMQDALFTKECSEHRENNYWTTNSGTLMSTAKYQYEKLIGLRQPIVKLFRLTTEQVSKYSQPKGNTPPTKRDRSGRTKKKTSKTSKKRKVSNVSLNDSEAFDIIKRDTSHNDSNTSSPTVVASSYGESVNNLSVKSILSFADDPKVISMSLIHRSAFTTKVRKRSTSCSSNSTSNLTKIPPNQKSNSLFKTRVLKSKLKRTVCAKRGRKSKRKLKNQQTEGTLQNRLANTVGDSVKSPQMTALTIRSQDIQMESSCAQQISRKSPTEFPKITAIGDEQTPVASVSAESMYSVKSRDAFYTSENLTIGKHILLNLRKGYHHSSGIATTKTEHFSSTSLHDQEPFNQSLSVTDYRSTNETRSPGFSENKSTLDEFSRAHVQTLNDLTTEKRHRIVNQIDEIVPGPNAAKYVSERTEDNEAEYHETTEGYLTPAETDTTRDHYSSASTVTVQDTSTAESQMTSKTELLDKDRQFKTSNTEEISAEDAAQSLLTLANSGGHTPPSSCLETNQQRSLCQSNMNDVSTRVEFSDRVANLSCSDQNTDLTTGTLNAQNANAVLSASATTLITSNPVMIPGTVQPTVLNPFPVAVADPKERLSEMWVLKRVPLPKKAGRKRKTKQAPSRKKVLRQLLPKSSESHPSAPKDLSGTMSKDNLFKTAGTMDVSEEISLNQTDSSTVPHEQGHDLSSETPDAADTTAFVECNDGVTSQTPSSLSVTQVVLGSSDADKQTGPVDKEKALSIIQETTSTKNETLSLDTTEKQNIPFKNRLTNLISNLRKGLGKTTNSTLVLDIVPEILRETKANKAKSNEKQSISKKVSSSDSIKRTQTSRNRAHDSLSFRAKSQAAKAVKDGVFMPQPCGIVAKNRSSLCDDLDATGVINRQANAEGERDPTESTEYKEAKTHTAAEHKLAGVSESCAVEGDGVSNVASVNKSDEYKCDGDIDTDVVKAKNKVLTKKEKRRKAKRSKRKKALKKPTLEDYVPKVDQDDADDLPTILPPKRRRQAKPASPHGKGIEDCAAQEQSNGARLAQEFPRHNWLENKIKQSAKQCSQPDDLPSQPVPVCDEMMNPFKSNGAKAEGLSHDGKCIIVEKHYQAEANGDVKSCDQANHKSLPKDTSSEAGNPQANTETTGVTVSISSTVSKDDDEYRSLIDLTCKRSHVEQKNSMSAGEVLSSADSLHMAVKTTDQTTPAPYHQEALATTVPNNQEAIPSNYAGDITLGEVVLELENDVSDGDVKKRNDYEIAERDCLNFAEDRETNGHGGNSQVNQGASYDGQGPLNMSVNGPFPVTALPEAAVLLPVEPQAVPDAENKAEISVEEERDEESPPPPLLDPFPQNQHADSKTTIPPIPPLVPFVQPSKVNVHVTEHVTKVTSAEYQQNETVAVSQTSGEAPVAEGVAVANAGPAMECGVKPVPLDNANSIPSPSRSEEHSDALGQSQSTTSPTPSTLHILIQEFRHLEKLAIERERERDEAFRLRRLKKEEMIQHMRRRLNVISKKRKFSETPETTNSTRNSEPTRSTEEPRKTGESMSILEAIKISEMDSSEDCVLLGELKPKDHTGKRPANGSVRRGNKQRPSPPKAHTSPSVDTAWSLMDAPPALHPATGLSNCPYVRQTLSLETFKPRDSVVCTAKTIPAHSQKPFQTAGSVITPHLLEDPLIQSRRHSANLTKVKIHEKRIHELEQNEPNNLNAFNAQSKFDLPPNGEVLDFSSLNKTRQGFPPQVSRHVEQSYANPPAHIPNPSQSNFTFPLKNQHILQHSSTVKDVQQNVLQRGHPAKSIEHDEVRRVAVNNNAQVDQFANGQIRENNNRHFAMPAGRQPLEGTVLQRGTRAGQNCDAINANQSRAQGVYYQQSRFLQNHTHYQQEYFPGTTVCPQNTRIATESSANQTNFHTTQIRSSPPAKRYTISDPREQAEAVNGSLSQFNVRPPMPSVRQPVPNVRAEGFSVAQSIHHPPQLVQALTRPPLRPGPPQLPRRTTDLTSTRDHHLALQNNTDTQQQHVLRGPNHYRVAGQSVPNHFPVQQPNPSQMNANRAAIQEPNLANVGNTHPMPQISDIYRGQAPPNPFQQPVPQPVLQPVPQAMSSWRLQQPPIQKHPGKTQQARPPGEHSRHGYSCAECKRRASMICSRCESVRYCSKECQIKGWPRHGFVCKPRS